MAQFYDRDKELRSLLIRHKRMEKGIENGIEKGMEKGMEKGTGKGELVIVYGRRRVGKTSLIKKFLEEVGGFYCYVDYADGKDVLRRISSDLSEQAGAPASFGDWDDLYAYLSKLPGRVGQGDQGGLGSLGGLGSPGIQGGRGAVVAFDEFQRVYSASPLAISRLQHFWDSELKDKKIMIVLLGSSIGMMRKVAVGGGAPLYGRATATYNLQPFEYADARQMFAGMPEDEMMQAFATFGGTPHYLAAYKDSKLPLFDAVNELVLKQDAPLREEPLTLLRMELKETARYNSILSSIARGKQTLTELSDATQIENTKLGYYLENLIELLGIIAVKHPVLGKKKVARYVFRDNFFRFWYKYVFPNRSTLELGNPSPVLARIKAELQTDLGFVFEDVARGLLTRYNGAIMPGAGKTKLDIRDIGAWWNRVGEEIDICAPGGSSLILGEAKYTNKLVDTDVAKELMRKSALVKWDGEGKKQYIIFSKAGFTKDCAKFAKENGISILSLADMIRLFDAANAKERSARLKHKE